MNLREKLEGLPAELFTNGNVSFRPIKDEEDLIYALFDCQLDDAQKELVNPAAFSVGRAFLRPGDNVPCVILDSRGER